MCSSDLANSMLTKRAMVAALRELLATKPFERITVAEIARRCGINRQTFYYHFHDIYDLVSWGIEDQIMSAFMVDRADWQRALTEVLRTLRDDRLIVLAFMRSADVTNMYRILRTHADILALSILEHSPRCNELPPQDKRLVLDFYAAGFAEVIIIWLENGCTEEPERLVARIASMLGRGLLA